MQLLRVRFDRIFDVVLDPMKSHSLSTLFSFESGGKRYFSISITGKPRLENGMEVVAALSKKDDWQSLLGWKDLLTGEIHVSSGAHAKAAIAITSSLFLTGAAGFFYSGSYWFLGLSVLMSVLLLPAVRELQEFKQARKALEKA